jgi:twitching motility protein PilT
MITYEEALRQSTNPDDFALRVSGISATSDSTWDSFEGKPEQAGGKPAPGARAAARPPQAAPGRPAPPSPNGKPAAKPAAPASGSAPGGDDDFQIERF